MSKTIELNGDWNIPEGYTNKAEFRAVKFGDFYINGVGYLSRCENESEVERNKACGKRFCLIPERKQIDWKKIIDNGILCQFTHNENAYSDGVYSKLYSFGEFFESAPILRDRNGESVKWTFCRPAYGIRFGHNGGECPLPPGLKVEALTHNINGIGDAEFKTIAGDSANINWSRVVNYEIIGISWGYVL